MVETQFNLSLGPRTASGHGDRDGVAPSLL